MTRHTTPWAMIAALATATLVPLLSACDTAEQTADPLPAQSTSAAPRTTAEYDINAYSYYLANEAEAAKKASACAGARAAITAKMTSAGDLDDEARQRLKELKRGACKAASDAQYEQWHAKQAPQILYRPTKGAQITGRGADVLRKGTEGDAQ